jgi:hypothetical protein
MINKINSNIDCFLIPLADAFRDDAILWLGRITDAINKLKIPCIVTSVGLRASYEANITIDRPIDAVVRRFVKAILKKSSIMGVRGEITGKYLSLLGFKEDKDYMITGCPSLSSLVPQQLKIDVPSELNTIGINANVLQPSYVSDFFCKAIESFKEYYIIQQKEDEFSDIYLSKFSELNIRRKNFPSSIYGRTLFNSALKTDRVKAFGEISRYIEFFKQNTDLSLSSRFHGSVMSIVANVPTLTIPLDSRMNELADYHNLARIKLNDLKDGTRTLNSFMEKLDLHAPEKVSQRNFDRWMKFLDINKVKSKLNSNNSYLEGAKSFKIDEPIPFGKLNFLSKFLRISKYIMNKPINIAYRRLVFEITSALYKED